MAAPERDDYTGIETTKHEWDGIHELDTPLPRWWLWTFYITIVWGIIYTIAYPAWPMISTATKGVLGYSSRAEVAASIAEVQSQNAEISERVANASFAEIAADPELDTFAKAGGAAVFRTYCSQCHGAGAAGLMGAYPNLVDDDWLWGGEHDTIYTTIKHGIRWAADDETRFSEMPAFGRDEILSRPDIAAVADHVLSLSGGEASPEGATLYADNCAACHGDDGTGGREFGAPNLADAIWLYGGSRDQIIASINNARGGVMPAWSTRLSETELKQVAHYVHSLGGGE